MKKQNFCYRLINSINNNRSIDNYKVTTQCEITLKTVVGLLSVISTFVSIGDLDMMTVFLRTIKIAFKEYIFLFHSRGNIILSRIFIFI